MRDVWDGFCGIVVWFFKKSRLLKFYLNINKTAYFWLIPGLDTPGLLVKSMFFLQKFKKNLGQTRGTKQFT